MSTAPGPGHNQPPTDPFENARALVANANRWIAERPEIATEEQAGSAQTFVDQLLATRDDLDAAWAKEREPFDQELVLLRVRYRAPLDLLDVAIAAMRAKAAVWLRKKRDRLDAEKREREGAARRLRAEAERKLAARICRAAQRCAWSRAQVAAQHATVEAARVEKALGRKPTRAQVKSDYAAKAMSLRTVWHAHIVDESKALDFFCNRGGSRAALLALCLAEANRMARRDKRTDAAPPGVGLPSTTGEGPMTAGTARSSSRWASRRPGSMASCSISRLTSLPRWCCSPRRARGATPTPLSAQSNFRRR